MPNTLPVNTPPDDWLDWSDRPAVIAASGPSLESGQLEHCRRSRARVIVVNTTFKMAPWADVLYACDAAWWRAYAWAVPAAIDRWTQRPADGAGKGEEVRRAQERAIREFNLKYVDAYWRPGLGKEGVHYGGNSGYQAVNLAYLFGARWIALLGFDMGMRGTRRHWHEDHAGMLNKTCDYGRWRENFRALAAALDREDVNVINCTPGSQLVCFPKAKIEDLL